MSGICVLFAYLKPFMYAYAQASKTGSIVKAFESLLTYYMPMVSMRAVNISSFLVRRGGVGCFSRLEKLHLNKIIVIQQGS